MRQFQAPQGLTPQQEYERDNPGDYELWNKLAKESPTLEECLASYPPEFVCREHYDAYLIAHAAWRKETAGQFLDLHARCVHGEIGFGEMLDRGRALRESFYDTPAWKEINKKFRRSEPEPQGEDELPLLEKMQNERSA